MTKIWGNYKRRRKFLKRELRNRERNKFVWLNNLPSSDTIIERQKAEKGTEKGKGGILHFSRSNGASAARNGACDEKSKTDPDHRGSLSRGSRYHSRSLCLQELANQISFGTGPVFRRGKLGEHFQWDKREPDPWRVRLFQKASRIFQRCTDEI